MAILQVRDIDEHLYDALKSAARSENRSISQEVIVILRKYLANPAVFQTSPTCEFLSLAGSWSDKRTADDVIADIRKQRRRGKRFGENRALFD